ncbi:Interferon regulatory factor 4, partial [Balearica regulorum gibbericeps]
QAWAIYKGKYHEGTDKADPSTWKTRLRCALNKSTDFQEVPERSQLDISEPYKVYQIVSDGARDTGTVPCCWLSPHHRRSPPQGSTAGSLEESQKGTMGTCHVSPLTLLSAHPAERERRQLIMCLWALTRPGNGQQWWEAPCYPPGPGAGARTAPRGPWGQLLTSLCHLVSALAQGTTESPPPRALGSSGRVAGMTDVLERLLPHLERGVLLWVAPEGVFMKRQCQGRVYWNGPLAPHRDWPNKLEREKTYKLLDTQQFLQRAGAIVVGVHTDLCPFSVGSIPPQVEPVFARELFHHAQRMGPTLLRDSPQPCTPGT